MGNSNYDALEITLNQKAQHGLSYTINYTYSKLYDDTGTGRTAYGNNAYIEHALSTTDQPSNVSAYAVWEEPFGKNGGNRFVNALIKNYAISGIYRYTSGYPIVPTASGCTQPFSGTCMPSINPNYSGSARINGGYGNALYSVATTTRYFDPNAFLAPGSGSTYTPGVAGSKSGTYPAYLIGNSSRTYPFGLRAPGGDDTDVSLRRTFGIYERLNLTMQADVFNLTNNVRFKAPGSAVGSSSFGLITGTANSSRDIQFSGRIDF
jgi:hypothetical protein